MTCFPVDKIEQYCPSEDTDTVIQTINDYFNTVQPLIVSPLSKFLGAGIFYESWIDIEITGSYNSIYHVDLITDEFSECPHTQFKANPKEYHALCYWFHNVRHLYYFMSPLGNLEQILPNSLHSYDIAHFYSFVAGYKIYSHVFLSMSPDKQYCVNIFYFGNFDPPPPYVYNNYRASFYFNPYSDYSCSDLSDHYHSSMSYKTKNYVFEEYCMEFVNALDAAHPLKIHSKSVVYANVDSQGQTFYLHRITYRWSLTSL